MYDDRYKMTGGHGETIDDNIVKQLEYLLDEARKGQIKSVMISMTHVDGRWAEDDGILIGQPSDVPMLSAQASGCMNQGMKHFRQLFSLSEHPLGKAN